MKREVPIDEPVEPEAHIGVSRNLSHPVRVRARLTAFITRADGTIEPPFVEDLEAEED